MEWHNYPEIKPQVSQECVFIDSEGEKFIGWYDKYGFASSYTSGRQVYIRGHKDIVKWAATGEFKHKKKRLPLCGRFK